MNFHFPLMPRMFMSVHLEDRFPIVDILRQDAVDPGQLPVGDVLAHHDERRWRWSPTRIATTCIASTPRIPNARINLGIRRRLAPLVKGRRKIELMKAMLMSLPGTPVLYYGDEIGMGDNIYLGDRDGVRTPMQWSADRNAGFSKANPQKLFLPIITDPEYHYEAITCRRSRPTVVAVVVDQAPHRAAQGERGPRLGRHRVPVSREQQDPLVLRSDGKRSVLVVHQPVALRAGRGGSI